MRTLEANILQNFSINFLELLFQHKARPYLMNYCIHAVDNIFVLFCQASLPRCASTQSELVWASCVILLLLPAGPTAWNSLSDYLHDLTLSTDSFRCLLIT